MNTNTKDKKPWRPTLFEDKEVRRVCVTIPVELVDAINGKRNLSKFLVEAGYKRARKEGLM